jgi:hypothetical protein
VSDAEKRAAAKEAAKAVRRAEKEAKKAAKSAPAPASADMLTKKTESTYMTVETQIPPGAMVADNLSDFGKGVDDSLVFPRGAAPEIKNVTQVAPRHFRFELRMRGDPWTPLNPGGTRGAWYDGDRNLEWNEGKRDGKYHPKSRAEVNWVLEKTKFKVPMKNNETWEIATTVKLDPNFVPSRGYCNIMQPVFDQSFLNLTGIKGDDVTADMTVFTNSKIGGPQKVARSFVIKRGVWTSIVLRIKFGKDGRYDVSVNGDPFKGIGFDTGKIFASRGIGMKWGIYSQNKKNGSVEGKPMKDLIVEHKNIYVRKV